MVRTIVLINQLPASPRVTWGQFFDSKFKYPIRSIDTSTCGHRSGSSPPNNLHLSACFSSSAPVRVNSLTWFQVTTKPIHYSLRSQWAELQQWLPDSFWSWRAFNCIWWNRSLWPHACRTSSTTGSRKMISQRPLRYLPTSLHREIFLFHDRTTTHLTTKLRTASQTAVNLLRQVRLRRFGIRDEVLLLHRVGFAGRYCS